MATTVQQPACVCLDGRDGGREVQRTTLLRRFPRQRDTRGMDRVRSQRGAPSEPANQEPPRSAPAVARRPIEASATESPPAAPEAPPPAPPPVAETLPVFKAEQLDQLLAPIALYPDALLAQILMAATYPLDVVEADRWRQDRAHANLQGAQLAAAIEAEPWDPVSARSGKKAPATTARPSTDGGRIQITRHSISTRRFRRRECGRRKMTLAGLRLCRRA
jgi:Protein of unknown function (DUF3300)